MRHGTAFGGLFFVICDLRFTIYDWTRQLKPLANRLIVNFMTRQQVLDLYFLDARHKLVEIAAFLDRVERADGTDDFRLKAFRAALGELGGGKKQKAKNVLLAFSDPTTKPIAKAAGKGATGAWNSVK
jgi:hypothetical protein